ncbi:hypothetical protein [Fructobacillus durionis]|uniref:Uncharacterized protein n=1 Tax=Fructobacillus durionis TaxID=283737 RepID=A0A1I1HKH8_9LACO|nr:hypothetical protein [Fructobacillus durionis]SFC24474.1 hypothetical protein SAMN05660453_0041 [Fructobacillus durionis]
MFKRRQKDFYSIEKVIKKSDNEFDVFVTISLGKKKQKKIRKFNKKLSGLTKLLKEIEKL